MTTRNKVSSDRVILICVILVIIAILASPPHNDFHFWFHVVSFFAILVARAIDHGLDLPDERGGVELTVLAIFGWLTGNVLFWLYLLE